MQANLTANGSTDAEHGMIVEAGKARHLTPEQAHVMVRTIGRTGAWLGRTDTGPAQLSVPVYFAGTTPADAEVIRGDIAAWLVSPVAYQITLAEVTGYWLGKLSDVPVVSFDGPVCRTTLVFDLFSPYLYGADVTQTIADGVNVIPYAGTAPTDPVITLIPDADVGFVRATCVETGEFVTLGVPETYDDALPKGMTPLLSVSGADVPTASDMTYCDGGIIAGTLVSNGYSLSPGWTGGSYGSGADKHGPGKVWPLAAVATDFRAEAVLAWIDNASRGMGRVELCLYDSAADFSAAHVLGKVALKDATISAISTIFEARAGTLATGHTLASKTSKYWNSGKIQIGIGRENHRWTCDIGVWVAGRWQARFSAAFTELSTFETYGATVAAVGLHIGQYVAYPLVTQQACYSIAVSGIGMAGADALIPANSEVVMDNRNGAATLDGTDVRALVDPHSRPFAIPVNGCSLLVETTGGGADDALVASQTSHTSGRLTTTYVQTPNFTLATGTMLTLVSWWNGWTSGSNGVDIDLYTSAGVFVTRLASDVYAGCGTEGIADIGFSAAAGTYCLRTTFHSAPGRASDVFVGASATSGATAYFTLYGAAPSLTGTLVYTERDL